MVQALADQQAELEELVGEADEATLDAPTRCAGWSVADVLLHLAQTNEAAVASVEGRIDDLATMFDLPDVQIATVDDWAGAAVAAERGAPGSEVRDRWRRSAADQVAAFASCDPGERVTWVAGTLAARTLAATRLSESWIHTVDVASATGSRPAPTDRLRHVVRLAWRTLPYAFARAGRELTAPVAFELVGPGGDVWSYRPDDEPDVVTEVRGTAADLCEVAAQRASARDTGLVATGPDAEGVLELVRTFA